MIDVSIAGTAALPIPAAHQPMCESLRLIHLPVNDPRCRLLSQRWLQKSQQFVPIRVALRP